METKYHTTKYVITKVGISRNTLFLWFKHHKIPEVKRNRNGHRLFTKQDVTRILRYKNTFNPPSPAK